MKAGLGRPIALVLGAVLVAAFLWSQRPHPRGVAAASERAATAVRVAEAEERVVPSMRETVGTLRSRHEVELAARTTAAVVEVTVEPGDEVRAGQRLVALDDAGARAAVAQAEAVQKARDEALAEARRELDRTRALLEREARTQSELDAATTAFEAARALAAAAAEAVAAARVALDDTVLVAPSDGVVTERAVDPGDMALPGRVLVSLFDPAALRVEVPVPSTLVAGLGAGDELDLSVDALPEAGTLHGRVEEIVPVVDAATRTTLVKLALDPVPGARPGMFARVQLPVGERRALVVPAAALVRRGQLELVFTVEGEGRARMHLVRSGRRLPDGGVELLAGLRGAARVVAEGADELLDGARIRVETTR